MKTANVSKRLFAALLAVLMFIGMRLSARLALRHRRRTRQLCSTVWYIWTAGANIFRSIT